MRAYKRISIDAAPNVLTVHLKRFDFFGRGHKLSKRVEFDLELDLGPFMTHPGASSAGGGPTSSASSRMQLGAGRPVMYDLYAVLVHLGHSLHSGHYVCYVKAGNGIWHLCDDHRVAQVSQRVVEGQQAYMLFYVRRGAGAGNRHGNNASGGAAAANAAAAAAGLTTLLGGSDSTRTPLLDATLTAPVNGRPGVGAAAAGSIDEAGARARGQSGNVSAADAGGSRRAVTSSTESTANVSSPVGNGELQRCVRVCFV